MTLRTALARYRVPLGFAAAAAALAVARPTPASIVEGMLVALAGELVRIWAAGHIEKGTEITRSGPYRLVRHPLYLGSAIMGAGFAWAARSWAAASIAAVYLAATLAAAMRTEEAQLDRRFGGGYTEYREGRAPAVDRRFSLGRAWANREHRAVLGLAVATALLYLRFLLAG